MNIIYSILAAVVIPVGADGLQPADLKAQDVLDRMAAAYAGCKSYIDSGVVETVTVEPVFRRQGIGRVLATAAEGLRLVRGWAPLTTDGRLTDSGASWLDGAPPYWRPRLAERTVHIPEDDPEFGAEVLGMADALHQGSTAAAKAIDALTADVSGGKVTTKEDVQQRYGAAQMALMAAMMGARSGGGEK